MSCFSACLASVDICQEPATYSHLSIAYDNHETSSIDRTLGEIDQRSYRSDLLFRLNDKWMVGGGHRYTVAQVYGLELQTNGHLHTFFLPVHRLSRTDRTSFRVSIAPAVSASSNVISRPNEYTADALQLLAAMVWGRQISDRMRLRYGICGDHRFGPYRVYPLIKVEWRPHRDWTVDLGWPTSQVSYQVSTDLTSLLRITPDGNQWYIKGKRLERQSTLTYEAYAVEWIFNWQAYEGLLLSANVGRQFHNRYKAALGDGSRARFSSESVTRVGVALVWRF